MNVSRPPERRRLEQLQPGELAAYQLNQLNGLLEQILPGNAFYAQKLSGIELPLKSLADVAQLPFTSKDELVGPPSEGDLAANRTYDMDQYVRFHRTSGTKGRPLVVLDTARDWQWWIDGWQYVLDSADVTTADRVFMAFSFGPFIGFWSANDAAVARGCLVIPGGGMSSEARLQLIRSTASTVLCCTPTYALHLAEVASRLGLASGNLPIQKIIVAGEPGGSVPAIRARIEQAWGAVVFDHSGASEVGPWGYADPQRQGLHVNEAFFYPEFISVDTGQAAADGELAELILTTLGRAGSPVIRYRTGDLVRATRAHQGNCRFVLLEGGVLARADDMMVVRGVNIFPSSVEQILRSFPEVVEYRMIAHKHGEMDALRVEVEDDLDQPDRIGRELNLQLGLKIEVTCVPGGSLPRFEGKGRRFVDERRGS